MILYTLIISVILFVIFIFTSGSKKYANYRWFHYSLAGLALIVFLGSETLLIMNEHNHFGMKTKVYTQKVSLYSATGTAVSPQVPFMLLHQDAGKDRIYIYNVEKQGKPKMKHTQITDKNRVKNTDQEAYLAVEKKRRVFKNDFYKKLFAYSGNKNVLVSTRNVFYLPENHQVMSVKEMKKMQKEMQKKQAKQKQPDQS
ncbi:DUF4811 domain-containing protein [Sporolactobacillus shoreicorticis]|uniref:DUF4811 domain-containing protein n=1 Tax=Sporolactobacillus shoreicorticis TaxID=1923877 RepID=A0ABW5RZM8_9BACL|nr:DUF4811 domain-containing protein [Sporolactobacillus shoreicorticis]MCO7127224.1 DUF4811 domain-containing protein [Sporolactobacillus shoreicorticis]